MKLNNFIALLGSLFLLSMGVEAQTTVSRDTGVGSPISSTPRNRCPAFCEDGRNACKFLCWDTDLGKPLSEVEPRFAIRNERVASLDVIHKLPNVFIKDLGDATTVSNSPSGPTYIASIPEGNAYGISGYIVGTTGTDNEGVFFNVEFEGIPSEGGPFGYHLHAAPVNGSGSCASTLAHLDPFIRGQVPACDNTKPETCEVGDLSGKHGKIPAKGGKFSDAYSDPFVSLTSDVGGSFFGNRSFVIHLDNTTRVACANFELYQPEVPGNGTGNGTGTPKPTYGTPSPTGPGSIPTGGAGQMIGSAVGGLLVAGLAALI